MIEVEQTMFVCPFYNNSRHLLESLMCQLGVGPIRQKPGSSLALQAGMDPFSYFASLRLGEIRTDQTN
jgi:hypothetical protein